MNNNILDLKSDHFLVAIPNSAKRIKINFDTIAYIEADSMQCNIWLHNNSLYVVNKPMGAVFARLPATYFKQCHRSYVINVNYVKHVEQGKVQLHRFQRPIPIGSRKIHVEFDAWDKTNSL